MERTELEAAAVRIVALRGLLAVPAGLLFVATGIANLSSGLPGDPVTMPVLIAVLGAAAWVVNRWYDDHYGRVHFTFARHARRLAVTFLCFGVPMVGGTILDFQLDLPVSLFSVLFGTGMLVWFGTVLELAPFRIAVWGSLIVVGLVPVWGGLDDRASAGWIPVGIACIVAGVLDHLALQRTYGPVHA